jgi:hypothetical protein
VVYGLQENDQEMRKLTRMLAGRLERRVDAGSELNFADSGDDLRKGMDDFAQLGPPQND